MTIKFILFVLILFNISRGQIVTGVYISDGTTLDLKHSSDIKESFIKGYAEYDGSIYSGKIIIDTYNSSPTDIMKLATDSICQIIIRSRTGIWSFKEIAGMYDPVLFMAAGSNSFSYVNSMSIFINPIISTGCGIDSLVTGYNAEFYDIDPITTGNLSSYSNGYIAGKIAFISNKLNCSIEEARQKAREFCLCGNTIKNITYGRINIFKVLPVTLSNFHYIKNKKVVTLLWQTITEINNYGFDIEKSNDKQTWSKIGFIKGNGTSSRINKYTFIDNAFYNTSFYRLKQIDNDGNFEYSNLIKIFYENFNINQNYPNPFNSSTIIQYSVTERTKINITIYNILGQPINNLLDEYKEKGNYTIRFDANNLDSGIYFCKLNNNVIKMLLIK